MSPCPIGIDAPDFSGSRSFRAINVGTAGKLVSAAVSVFLSATVLTLDELIAVK